MTQPNAHNQVLRLQKKKNCPSVWFALPVLDAEERRNVAELWVENHFALIFSTCDAPELMLNFARV